MSVELKIKSNHLSHEPAIIRREERKLLKMAKWERENTNQLGPYTPSMEKRESLYEHRVKDVRNEARATFLARAFISGAPYKSVEQTTKEDYKLYFVILPRVVSMVGKYDPRYHIPRRPNSKHYRYEEMMNMHEKAKARLREAVDAWMRKEE